MTDEGKITAAKKALGHVRPGMTIGLGTGSTTAYFVKMLGEKNREKNMELKCISTSLKTEKLARKYGLSTFGFEKLKSIDIAIDGADVVVGNNLIKGLGGGAITREKAVDYRSLEFIVIVDPSKLSRVFGGNVPVEVLPFASEAVRRDLKRLGAKRIRYRMNGKKRLVTDNGNYIIDSLFSKIERPADMERKLNMIPGVVENGIFTRKCIVIVGR